MRNLLFKCSSINVAFLNLAYFFDVNVRLMWSSYYILSFYEIITLNILSIVTLFSIVPNISTEENLSKDLEALRNYVYFLSFSSTFVYILERQLIICFYCNWIAEKKAKWLSNVFNNMNSGFVSLKGDKIAFINNFLLKYLKNNKSLSKLQTIRNENIISSTETERINCNIKNCKIN